MRKFLVILFIAKGGGEVRQRCPPQSSISSIFMPFLGNFWPNNSLIINPPLPWTPNPDGTKTILMDNHYKTTYEPGRTGYSFSKAQYH